jgi:uncharacterized protein YecE (DUF72 family)
VEAGFARLYVGTSGYSYKEWKGSFYPEKLPAKEMLRFYAEHFGAVEINNTFYRMPQRAVLAAWAKEVPDGFTFVLKASQRITHIKRLRDVEGEVAYFFETASELGPKLGPCLFQLPPNARKDVDRLGAFLAILPKDRRVAFEFRHPSWMDPEVLGLLKNANAALCLADMEEEAEDESGAGELEDEVPWAGPEKREPPPILSTADWGYLRLRRCDYTDADLTAWAARMKAERWKDVFVFFKHEDEGTGPELARHFIPLYRGGEA